MKLLRENPRFGSAFYVDELFLRPSIEPMKYRIMQGYAYKAWMILLDYFNRDERRCHAQYQRRVTGLVTTYENLPEFSVTRSGKRYATNHLDAQYSEFDLMKFFENSVEARMSVDANAAWSNNEVVNRAAYALMFLLNLLRSTDSRLDAAGAIRDESWGRSIVLIHPMQEIQRITGILWPDQLFLNTVDEVHSVERMMEYKSRLGDLDWFKESDANLAAKWRSSLIGYARRNLRNDPGNPYQKAYSEAIAGEIYIYLSETFMDCEEFILMRTNIQDAITLRLLGEINSMYELTEERIYDGAAMENFRGFLSTRSSAHRALKYPLSPLSVDIIRQWFQGQKDQELVDLVIRDLERFQEWRYADAKLEHVKIMKVNDFLNHCEWPYATFVREKYNADTGVSEKVESTVYADDPVLVIKDKFVSDQAKRAVMEELGDINGVYTSFLTDVRGEEHFWNNSLVTMLRDLATRALSDQLMEHQFYYETGTKDLTDEQKDAVRSLLVRIRKLGNKCVTVPKRLFDAIPSYYDQHGILTTMRPVETKPLGGDFIQAGQKYAVLDQTKPTGYSPVTGDHWDYLFSVNTLASPLEIDPIKPLDQLLDVAGRVTVIEPQDIDSNLFVNGLDGTNFYGLNVMTSREDAAQVTFPNLRFAGEVVSVVMACFEEDIFVHIKPGLKDIIRNWLAKLPGHLQKIGRQYPPILLDAMSRMTKLDQRYVYYRSMVGRADLLEINERWVPTFLFGDLFGQCLAEATIPFKTYGDNIKPVASKNKELEPTGEIQDFRLKLKDFLIKEIFAPKLMVPKPVSDEKSE
jgi:hypothetical protein